MTETNACIFQAAYEGIHSSVNRGYFTDLFLI